MRLDVFVIMLSNFLRRGRTKECNCHRSGPAFYRAALNAGRSSQEKAVRLSALSVCQTRDLWQNGRKNCPDFCTIRKTFSLVIREEARFVGATPSTWNFGSTGPRWSEIADFEPIFARSASTVPSEKVSINTNRKSTSRFPMNLKMIIVRCP